MSSVAESKSYSEYRIVLCDHNLRYTAHYTTAVKSAKKVPTYKLALQVLLDCKLYLDTK